jgi:lactoylglutathione lyase
MAAKRKRIAETEGSELAFNHAMVYVQDVDAALHFYKDLLGFKVVDDYLHDSRLVYARLRSPRGSGTLALHMIEPGRTLPPGDAIRLYLETNNVEAACNKLRKAGVKISQETKLMPWGWIHAYVNDPDGHEISLYSSGGKRFRRTMSL